MNLDGFEFHNFDKDITKALEALPNLPALTLNECKVQSLENFPTLPNLIRLEMYENSFRAKDLALLPSRTPKLRILLMGKNDISEFIDVESLKGLKELFQLDLSLTNLS